MIRRTFSNERAWITWTLGVYFLLQGIALFCLPSFSYNHWDNFNYFTPLLTETHTQWLLGRLPLWHDHQHLGEPLLGFGMGGALYFPYTIAVGLVRLLQLAPDQLCLVIFMIHMPWAIWGWYRLLRRFGVSSAIACGASLALCNSGGILLLSMAWIFVAAYFTWMPWLLSAALDCIEKRNTFSHGVLAVGFAATAAIGHPQFFAYIWIWIGCWVVLETLLGLQPYRHLGRLVLPFISGLLLSMLFWLPFCENYVVSYRSHGLPLDVFLSRSVDMAALQGILWPLLQLPNTYFKHQGSVALFQGIWVAPSILLGILALKRRRSPLAKRFCIAGLLALFFVVFALGKHTPLYPWTHHIPLWGSFRWPFRLLLVAIPSLGLASALGLTMVTREIIQRRWRWLILSLAIVSSGWTLGLSHLAQMPEYREVYGDWGPARLGINPEYRVLPVGTPATVKPHGQSIMQPLALFASATANGYRSATGSTGAMTSRSYLSMLMSNDMGLLYPTTYPSLLSSHLLRTWNIRYIVFHAEDVGTRRMVDGIKGYQLVKDLGISRVYENTNALQAAYFAGQMYRMEAQAFRDGLLLNKKPIDSVYLDAPPTIGPLPRGKILEKTGNAGEIRFLVEAPLGGFFVLAQVYYPQWHAWINGKEVTVHVVNGLVMGVHVPPGTQSLEWRYRSDGLRWGLWLASFGIVVLLLPLFRKRRFLRVN